MGNTLLVGRDPDAPKRTRRFMQIIQDIINTLELAPDNATTGELGVLHLEGVQLWGLACLFFHGNGPPAQSLAFIGDYYLDVANGIVYRKVS